MSNSITGTGWEVRALTVSRWPYATGPDPKAYIGDSADPSRVKTRYLSEEARRVFRSRVANPKWIEAMQRHGYKGAFELSATVDYLFGYDATANVVEDWMYRDVTRKYVLDEEVRAFMQESNPWALRAISERLLEAADRGEAEIEVESPDPQSRWNGLRIGLSNTSNAETFGEVRDEVFHPQTQVTLKVVDVSA